MCARVAVRTISAAVTRAFALFFSDDGRYYYADNYACAEHDKNNFSDSHNLYAPFFLNLRLILPLLYITIAKMTSAITAAQTAIDQGALPMV